MISRRSFRPPACVCVFIIYNNRREIQFKRDKFHACTVYKCPHIRADKTCIYRSFSRVRSNRRIRQRLLKLRRKKNFTDYISSSRAPMRRRKLELIYGPVEKMQASFLEARTHTRACIILSFYIIIHNIIYSQHMGLCVLLREFSARKIKADLLILYILYVYARLINSCLSEGEEMKENDGVIRRARCISVYICAAL